MLLRRPNAEQMQPIEALRVQIADLQNQVRDVLALPPSAGEVAERIDALAGNAVDRVQMSFLRRELLASEFNPIAAAAALRDLNASTLAVGTMRSAFVEGLTALCGQIGEGIDNATRARKLAELRAELDRLEYEEERLLAALESDAFVVRRRPNARAEIVLGITT